MHSHFTHYISPKPLTCLAFHPFEELFATGDSEGMIRLWYCLDPSAAPNQKRGGPRRFSLKAPTTTLHWHAHAVSGLTFTPNGAYLLSGGEEAVLVLWQLQTGHREFVPRLGAPIEHVTICPASLTTEQGYLLSLVDGSMSFVDSGSLNVTKTFTQVKRSISTYTLPDDSGLNSNVFSSVSCSPVGLETGLSQRLSASRYPPIHFLCYNAVLASVVPTNLLSNLPRAYQ